MKKKILNVILLLLFVSAFSFFIFIIQPDRLYLHGVVYEVRVINGFTNNSSLPLVIWCSSKDSDLGGRALQEHDDFSWRVTTKLWNTNQFCCTMKWDAKRKSFDAFKVPRDFYRCGIFKKCSWLVREDGFYFSPDEVNWKKDFQWWSIKTHTHTHNSYLCNVNMLRWSVFVCFLMLSCLVLLIMEWNEKIKATTLINSILVLFFWVHSCPPRKFK